MRSTYK